MPQKSSRCMTEQAEQVKLAGPFTGMRVKHIALILRAEGHGTQRECQYFGSELLIISA
jgi:hypothetical protein